MWMFCASRHSSTSSRSSLTRSAGKNTSTGTAIPHPSRRIFSGSLKKEAGYKFRPEYIIDQGYYNNQYRVPSKEYKDFQAFQRREVAKLAKEMVDITHELGKEAMMFLGDHWIGTEPFMPEFAGIGLDSVVGSVGNGSTLRLIADIPGVRYTEGRFLPYFFPDTFHPGGDPVHEAKGKLGHGAARHPPKAYRPHRLRRLSEAGVPVPGLHRLRRKRLS